MLLHLKKEDLGVDRVLFDAIVRDVAIPALSTFLSIKLEFAMFQYGKGI
jgi:hypothetical protein